MSFDVIIVSQDLLVLSQLEYRARQAQLSFQTIDHWPELAGELTDMLTPGGCWLIADLRVGPVPNELVAELHRDVPALKICAFGPHVQHELLAAASRAGCDDVWPRSKLDAKLAELWNTT